MGIEEKVKPRSVIAVWKSKGFIIGLILTVFMAVFNINMKLWFKIEFTMDWLFSGFVGPDGLYHWPTWGGTPYISAFFIPMMILVAVGALAKPLRLTANDYAIISAMVFATAMMPHQHHAANIAQLPAYQGIMVHGEPYSSLAPEAFHPLWSPLVGLTPEDPIYRGFLYGGMTPPWSIWAGTIALWFVYGLAFYFNGIFLMSLLRRFLIEVESLPFPQETGLARLIKEASTYEEGRRTPNLLRNKWLWIGFLIGWIITTPTWLHWLFPATFPLPPGGAYAGWGGALINLTPFNLIKNAWFIISFNPAYMGMGTLTPLSVSTSVVIFTILFWIILPPIYTAAGWFPPEPGSGGWGDPVWQTYNPDHPLFYTYPALIFGFTLALIAWPLIVLRGHYKQLFTSMYRKIRDGEEGEVLSYRNLWAGTIITWCIWVGVWIATGARASQVLLWHVIYVIMFVATVRMTSEGATIYGAAFGSFMSDGSAYAMVLVPVAQAVGPINDIPAFRTMFWNEQVFYDMGGASQLYTPTIASYKIADLTKTHARDAFIAICTIVPIVMLIALYFAFTDAYTYGIDRGYPWHTPWCSGWTTWIAMDTTLVTGTNVYGAPPTPKVGAQVLAALIVGLLLNYMRTRYARLRFISLAGLIASIMWFMGVYMWFGFLIGNIIRRVVFRMGGVRLWEDIGEPLGVGLLVSAGAVMFLVNICKWVPSLLALIA